MEAKSTRWLLRSRNVIPDSLSDVIADAGVLVEDGCVQSVGPFASVSRSYPLARVVEAEGDVIIPGLIDAHSHGRTLPLDAQGISGVSLEQFLLRIPAMTALDPRDDAFVAGADLLSTGVTTVQVNFHTFAEPDAYLQEARGALDGLRDSRIRATFVPCVMEQSEFVPEELLESAPSDLRELSRLARRGVGGRRSSTSSDAFASMTTFAGRPPS